MAPLGRVVVSEAPEGTEAVLVAGGTNSVRGFEFVRCVLQQAIGGEHFRFARRQLEGGLQ